MRAFWMAWGLAVLLLVVGTLGAMWIFGISAAWPAAPRILATIVGVALLLCTLVCAVRAGFLGTMALKQVLAENRAIVIAMELDDLRRAAEQHAQALKIPRFFGERDEIRKLLGKATEHTLEEIHASLQSYNDVARAAPADAEGRQMLATLLQGKAAVIQEQVGRAVRLLDQFLPSGGVA